MFWGLIIEPNKRYTQTVGKSFHVSMASLDAVTADNGIVQVMLCYDDRTYLLCSLKKDLAWQVPLDLNFQEGTKIAFTSNGRGHVHLTGYLIPEEEDDLDLDDMEEEDEEEEEEDDDEEVPQLVGGKQSKRKANESPKDKKKAKRLKAVKSQEESSEDEDDELDNEEDEESFEVSGEPEDDSDEAEDDDDDDDDDDDEDEDDSEDEEEVKTEVKPQQKKKQKQQQQQQQQQQQKQNAKQEKQKMVNGKDVKQDQNKQQSKKNKDQQPQQQQQNNAQQVQKKRIVEGGVQIEEVKVGNGAPAKAGKFVSVYYVGRLKNGKKFDSTQQGEGFKFRLGKGEVIKGWDVGIAGMKVGGKRKITIPPNFAYGAKGSPPTIPGNSTLVFEVELKNVH